MHNKLAIGTVQFGVDYGISNALGRTPIAEAKSILEHAFHQGISVLDTASAYGNAESVLGETALKPFKIVSKFPAGIQAAEAYHCLKRSLANIKREKLYGYIAHNATDFISNKELWDATVALKNSGLVQKIGYSLYTPEQMDQLLGAGMVPDLIQIPYNLLDTKFEPYLRDIKRLGVEIHARSAFLQGLFFMDILPAKLQSLYPAISSVKMIAEKNGLSISQLALNYVLHNEYVDHVVIGVNNLHQLKENLSDVLDNVPDDILSEVRAIEISDKSLLNPVNWK